MAGPLIKARKSPTARNTLTSEMPVITSKLTSKSQTTIPQPIRLALKLKEGDRSEALICPPLIHRQTERLLLHAESVPWRTLDALLIALALSRLGHARRDLRRAHAGRCLARRHQGCRPVSTSLESLPSPGLPRRRWVAFVKPLGRRTGATCNGSCRGRDRAALRACTAVREDVALSVFGFKC